MTQTGKCDTCRQRKVKCDEEKPKCGACKKKDRPCAYSYGRPSAFIVQDPNQLTKHGKSRVPSVVHSFSSSEDDAISSSSASSELRITTERRVGDGQGFFQTLAPTSKSKPRLSKKNANMQQRVLEAYLQHLEKESTIVPYQPSSPETALISRYIDMLGPDISRKQPLAILGTWIQTVPLRIGHNRMLDLAVEFLLNSYAAYRDGMHSKRRLAKATKAKALRELQLVVLNARTEPTYDLLLATKMHYAAEALMGIDTMYHAIHAFGLAELMKGGKASEVDDEHYWNLIDNTYVDDVNEAMLAGRQSVYYNDFYLSATYPLPTNSSISLSPAQRASMAIMHVFIQCPQIVCLIRQAILNPKDTSAIAAAVSHIESLMQVDLPQHVSELMQTAITVVPIPASPEFADLMPDTLEFDTVQNMILCTRYWMLQSLLCGLADTLYRRFPAEAALSLLPSPERLRVIDIDSALHLAKSLRWANSVSQDLPFVQLRMHTPIQMSIGPWQRTIRNLSAQRSNSPSIQPDIDAEISRAERMKTWAIDQCNKIHLQWGVSALEDKPLLETLEAMLGEAIPDWLPVRVRFEAEDGEMVMKLDYENKTGSYSERYDINEPPKQRSPHPILSGQEWQREALHVQELPLRGAAVQGDRGATEQVQQGIQSQNEYLKSYPRPADFIHGTGRNLCSTSGWWPETPRTSTVLFDPTHEASTFPRMSPGSSEETTDADMRIDRNPSLASTWWPQSPDGSTSLSDSAWRSFSTPPVDGRSVTVTFNNKKKNACFSPAWTNEG
ncbi:hypothetical protein COCVIDRAFT_26005 [Bipolaris victoriae FI3]|uniref:Zn(2)-C6 fungal-type domain-containing protein n=1 Tax=Bipolaris victoriae (strain FI3) TaxID=930091 RepID=W7EBM6_BIPV3|nr:hypothetical protein COCVIDRAFT_26005 [Bipolaris victoriae FI3]